MDDEVHDAYNECADNERESGLNTNASMQEVNAGSDGRQEPNNDAVHDKDAGAEREDDDRRENKVQDWFQNEIQKRQNEREEGKLPGVHTDRKTGDVKVDRPKRKRVPSRRYENPRNPMHKYSITGSEEKMKKFRFLHFRRANLVYGILMPYNQP
jgi:hypothetical protein